MPQPRLLSRIGHWFRAGNGQGDDSNGGGAIGRLLPEHAEDGAVIADVQDAVVRSSPLTMSRQDRALELLQDGHARVIALVESLQSHMDDQAGRTQAMAGSLGALAANLEPLPQAAADQIEALAAIQSSASEQATRAKRLDDHLAQLPRLADAQREAMAAIGRQLEQERRTGERVADVLDSLTQSLCSFGVAVESSTAANREIHSQSAAREERIARLFSEHSRRFTWLAAITLGTAAVATIVGLAGLLW